MLCSSEFSASDSAVIAGLASPICLPTKNYEHGNNGLVSGFGSDVLGSYISYTVSY